MRILLSGGVGGVGEGILLRVNFLCSVDPRPNDDPLTARPPARLVLRSPRDP